MSEADYAPFPENELKRLAGTLSVMSWGGAGVEICMNALKSFNALRERCLLAETENAQLRRKLLDSREPERT